VTRLRTIPLVLAALVLALATALSACSAASGTALSVNGITLSNRDFEEWLHVIASNKSLSAQTQTTGVNSSTYNTGFTVSVLNNQVTFALIEGELARRHITLTSSELDAAETSLETQLAPPTTDPSTGSQVAGTAAQGKAVLDSLGSFKTALIRATAGQTALQEMYAQKRGSDAVLRKLYADNPAQFHDKACANVIAVPAGSGQTDASGNPVAPTAADFATALSETKQIRSSIASAAASAGLATEFAAAASSVAQQEGLSSDGDLGCLSKGTYASSEPALEAALWSAPVGEMTQPIKSASGYLLLYVSARGNLTYDEAKPELQKAAATQAITDYNNWHDAAAKKADVSVDPQWGSWNPKTGAVVGPVGATSSTTSTTKPSGVGAGLGLGSTTTTSP
jgi:parvulin-like peptidyl-prolyl isomerase